MEMFFLLSITIYCWTLLSHHQAMVDHYHPNLTRFQLEIDQLIAIFVQVD